MSNQPHLCRRGEVYQWRRKIRRVSTGIVDFQVSLHTRDRERAIILARRLSAESERMVEALEQKYLSEGEARAWLGHVVRNEIDRLERHQLVQKMDGYSDDQEENARMDWAYRKAWQLIAAHGLNLRLTTSLRTELVREGADETKLEALQRAIDILSLEQFSQGMTRRNQRDFLTLSGRDDIGAFETLQLRQLVAEGKAAAWETVLGTQKRAYQDTARKIAQDALMCEATPSGDEIIQIAQRDLHGKPCESPSVQSPIISLQPTPLESGEYDPDIIATIQRMIELKRREGIEEKTLQQYHSFAKLFCLLTGKTDLRTLRQADAARFREMLARLPKSWGKSSKDATSTLDAILARSASLPTEKVGLSVGTVNRHLDHLKQLIDHADSEGIAIDEKLRPGKLRRKDPIRDSAKRDQFTEAQLRKLFTHPVWTGCRSAKRQKEPGTVIVKNGLYWVPLICAHSGARRTEIAGLSVADIQEEDGIPFFNIEETELRRVKTAASTRRVPIHSRLIELGFLDYVDGRRKSDGMDLFPDLYTSHDGGYGRKITREMPHLLRATLGDEFGNLSLHSTKHYVQNMLELNISVPEKVVREIVAHEGRDVHERTYNKGSPIQVLKAAIETLPAVF